MILRVPDIGDGLSAAIYTQPGVAIQIDCGSQQSAREAFEKGISRTSPDFFILSHFHSDHYNRLFEGVRTKEQFSIKQAIMPVIPQFTERNDFVHCLFAINARVLGGSSGSMDYDFLSIMNQLSRHRISYRRVKKGDEIVLGNAHFQILWPPQVLDDNEILSSVKKALSFKIGALIPCSVDSPAKNCNRS
jgi:beta-lactamase superfamily II metal-dependent hydrolase